MRATVAAIAVGLAGSIYTPRLFVALLLAAALGWWLRGNRKDSAR